MMEHQEAAERVICECKFCLALRACDASVDGFNSAEAAGILMSVLAERLKLIADESKEPIDTTAMQALAHIFELLGCSVQIARIADEEEGTKH